MKEAAGQAKAANPKVLLLGGLSTNPMGQSVTPDQLFEGVKNTRDYVDGYWLNIPGGGPYCPSCGEPKPAVAVALLKRLAGSN